METSSSASFSIRNFGTFDSTTELWFDYCSRLDTFFTAHTIPVSKKLQFLTNQLPTIYEMLSILATQEKLPKVLNQLSKEEIFTYMKGQFDPERFAVRERFRFWEIWTVNWVSLFQN